MRFTKPRLSLSNPFPAVAALLLIVGAVGCSDYSSNPFVESTPAVSAQNQQAAATAETPQTPVATALPVPEGVQTTKVSFNNGVQMVFIHLPAGEFIMGSPEGEAGRDAGSEPQKNVRIDHDFWIGQTEVTQQQWEVTLGNNPSLIVEPNNPVENVTIRDCQRFLNTLNAQGIGKFRLPTEAEWEYACRAGSTSRFYWAEDKNLSLIGAHAWFADNSSDRHQAVGQKMPNAWGLYDMSGNVWEGCTAVSETVDSSAGDQNAYVIRGGSFNNGATGCRSAVRVPHRPSINNSSSVGLRLVLVP